MGMPSETVVGAMIIAIPAIVLAWGLLRRRQRPVFWIAVALILVGTGYLAATGAADDIARRLAPAVAAPAKA